MPETAVQVQVQRPTPSSVTGPNSRLASALKFRHDMILSDASADAILCLHLSSFWMTR